MPDSKRWEPFVDGKRHCRKCGILKEQKDFHFNSFQGYWMGTCKDCDNAHRRATKNLTSEEKEKILSYHRNYHKINSKELEYKTTRALASYKRQDAEKGHQCELTRDFVLHALEQNCVYCNYPAIGLDRIDNSLGHTNTNCVPCCLECNNARMDNFSYEETFALGEIIRKIKDNRSKKIHMNDITFSNGAVSLIKQFEGFRSAPYLDSAGIPTIGYGTTFYEDGTKVTLQDPHIDIDRACSILLNYLNVRILPNFQTYITVDLTQNELDSLCSLCYNIGNSGFDHSHVLIDINQHILDGDLKKRWLAWDMAGGKVNEGLLSRRIKEYNYFETGSIN